MKPTGWLVKFFVLLSSLFLIASISLAQSALLIPQNKNAATSGKELEIRSAWYLWDPYQYEESVTTLDEKKLTGLDVELTRALFKRAGYGIQFEPLQWQAHQQAVQKGERDIAAGAFYNKERAKYAYYSNEYRREPNVLYVPKGKSKDYPFKGTDEMLVMFKAKKFRLGVVKGYQYADKKVNDYIANPNNANLLLAAKNEVENFRNMEKGLIDGFATDRIVGATIAWRNGWQKQAEEHPGWSAADSIHFLYSKKTVSPFLVQAINQAIIDMKKDGEYQHIVKKYMFPVMLGITVEQPWFFVIEIIGTIAFALSGVLIAHKEQYSIIGAFVLAGLPAIGGGIMRDLVVSRPVVGIVKTSEYLLTAMLVVIIGFVIYHIGKMISDWIHQHSTTPTGVPRIFFWTKWKPFFTRYLNWKWIEVLDALGLSAFTIIGVVVAVEVNLTPLILWGPLLGVITSSGGGVLRDMVRGKKDIPILKGEFYPEISVIWGVLFVLFMDWQIMRLDMNEIFIGVIVALIGGFITRLIALYFNVKSPLY